jgi:hypothetical protein
MAVTIENIRVICPSEGVGQSWDTPADKITLSLVLTAFKCHTAQNQNLMRSQKN